MILPCEYYLLLNSHSQLWNLGVASYAIFILQEDSYARPKAFHILRKRPLILAFTRLRVISSFNQGLRIPFVVFHSFNGLVILVLIVLLIFDVKEIQCFNLFLVSFQIVRSVVFKDFQAEVLFLSLDFRCLIIHEYQRQFLYEDDHSQGLSAVCLLLNILL